MHALKLHLNKIILYLFPLISYWGYGCVYTDLKIWKMLQFVALPLLLIYVLGEIFSRRKCEIAHYVTMIFFLVVLSVVMSFVVWNQDVLLGYRVTAGFLSIIFYFFLQKANFSKKEIERFVLFYGILWVIIWAINLAFAPVPIFGLTDAGAIDDSRGITRFFIQGNGFLYLIFFYFFNNWIEKKNGKYAVLFISIFVVIVLQVTRQTIAFSALVALYYLLKRYKRSLLYLVFAAIVLYSVDIDLPKNSVLGKMVELSQDQYKDNSSGKEYIRLEEYRYFFTEYSPTIGSIVFGNGLPHDDSNYGRFYRRLCFQWKYFYSDVGYAGIYIMMGIVGLFVFLRFFFILAKYSVMNSNLLWAKMFILYLFLCNTVSFVISTSIIPMAAALYVMKKDHDEDKGFLV